MRRRVRVTEVDPVQLASADPDLWLDPAERARVVDLVDDARKVWAADATASTVLERLAPGARYPARLLEDRTQAIRVTERLVVSYRRSMAGYRFAVETGRDGVQVAAEFGLGHVSRPAEDDAYWLATNRIE